MKSNPVLKTETAFTKAQTQESLKTQETNNTEKTCGFKNKKRELYNFCNHRVMKWISELANKTEFIVKHGIPQNWLKLTLTGMFTWGKHCQGITNVWNPLYVTSQTHPPPPRHQQSQQKILENSLLTQKQSTVSKQPPCIRWYDVWQILLTWCLI